MKKAQVVLQYKNNNSYLRHLLEIIKFCIEMADKTKINAFFARYGLYEPNGKNPSVIPKIELYAI